MMRLLRRMFSRVQVRTLGVAMSVAAFGEVVTASPVGAQSTTMHADSGTRRLELARLRACSRSVCGLTLETGTIEGSRLRIGASDRTVRVRLAGGAAYSHLAAIPEAEYAASQARSALRQRIAVAVITLGSAIAASAVAFREKRFAAESVSSGFAADGVVVRVGLVAVVSATGLYVASRRAHAAESHFEEAVRRYNEQLAP
jgi:hypothetical protein